MQPDFLAVNPGATVPVLVTDDDVVLTENAGIVAYLDAAFPEPPLLGRSPSERGLVAMWTAIAEFQGVLPVAEALRNASPHMKGRALPGPDNYAQIPELAVRGLARLDRFFDLLETRLQDSRFLALETLSYADITTFVFVDFARVVKRRIPEGNAATLAWFDGIAARDSAQA